MRKFYAGKTIQNYRFKSIFVQNLIIIFLVLLIPFSIICSFVYVKTQNSAKNEEKTFIWERLEKTVLVNDSFFQNLGRISAALNERNEFCVAMKIEDELINQSENYGEIMYELNMISMTNLYINSIIFYAPLNDRVVTTNNSGKLSELDNIQWIQDYLETDRDFYVRPLNEGDHTQTLVIRRFSNHAGITLGYLIILVDNEVYKKTFNLSNKGEKFLICDRKSSDIIFASLPELYNLSELSAMNVAPSKKFGWDYYYQVEKEYFNAVRSNNTSTFIVLYISVFILCALLAVLVSIKTFKPIKSIVQYLTLNNEREELAYYDTNELSYIMRNLMKLVGDREKLNTELENRMLLLNNAQIYALQYQINPHFIYNTLETVKWLIFNVEPENNHVASDVISRMSRIFKYSLNMQNYFVLLEEEIQNTKEYISILQVRYGGFGVNWNISPEAYKHKIIKLSLQPLIENAVFHGIQTLTETGIIDIFITEVNEKLVVNIQDNGQGVSVERLEELRRKLETDDVFSGENLGLSNLQRRIKLICGEEYGLSIYSGNGFKVIMIFP